MVMIGQVLLALAVVCFVLWLVFGYGTPRRVAGLPPGEVVYAGNERQARLLRAPQYNLLGKPDYVVKQGKEFIPVELKSGIAPRKLHESDRMQVIAQSLLVEAEFGRRPAYAFVQYPGRTYKVNVRPKSVARLEGALLVMREARESGTAPDVPPSWFFCPSCPRTECPKRARGR
jgi:CRISPR/Cas system-associated exonuclease Cas4 (RecB family)